MAPEARSEMAFETEHLRLAVGGDGHGVEFTDKSTGTDHSVLSPRTPIAAVTKGGRTWSATEAVLRDGCLHIGFGRSDVAVSLRVEECPNYLVFEVASVSGDGADEIVFLDMVLDIDPDPHEPFTACAVALNLQTNVHELPGPNTRLNAHCYPRFGFVGARVAVVGCPSGKLRGILQEVVSEAPELPHSPLGGPWAADARLNRGSYLFNFGDLTEETVDDWIDVAKELGFEHIDFHGGGSFRHGDCRPNPEMYPNGFASLKAVIDRLHDAGIAAGLHPYAFFIDPTCPWITPVPDPRLAKGASFTLAEGLSPDSATLRVVESTQDMSTVTGFAVRNSLVLQVDEELITFGDVDKQAPYGFTGCTRGAFGTSPAAHDGGAQVRHMKQCFGLFAPDGDSTLLGEVAQSVADAFNECGFDMMYLDALDGEDVLGGPENAWHYGSKFVYELWKRIDKPALMEMSTFHHHLWMVRSRLGAWDHPSRGYKSFIDLHVESNYGRRSDNAPALADHGWSGRRTLLPGHLGWWAFLPWDGPQQEATFPDDIEYLCCKALATDSSVSVMRIDPERMRTEPALRRLASICGRYEALRLAERVPESVRARLRAPGEEFRLSETDSGGWQFRPVRRDLHKAQGRSVWTVDNAFDTQPARLRIASLLSSGAYDAPGNPTILDVGHATEPSVVECADHVTVNLEQSSEVTPDGGACARFSARNERSDRSGAWGRIGWEFSAPVDASGRDGLGLWVHGDGRGQLLNVQIRSPYYMSQGIGEHYVVVDFTGWKCVDLVESEGTRCVDYVWPYARELYGLFRERVRHSAIAWVSLWYNDLPPGEEVACLVGPIKGLPLVEATLRSPTVRINQTTVTFPVDMETGSSLELAWAEDCRLYGPTGEELAEVRPSGDIPTLELGANEVEFWCDGTADPTHRASVSVISEGEPISEQ